MAWSDSPFTPLLNILRNVCVEDEVQTKIADAERSGIQGGAAVGEVLEARRLGLALVDAQGAISVDVLEGELAALSRDQHSLIPGRGYEGARRAHRKRVLELLQERGPLFQKVFHAAHPWNHPIAEQVIRDTLDLPKGSRVGDCETRSALLTAWMAYLRQGVGSCFATAPAIMIQQEQPERLLDDLLEIISSGSISRVIQGHVSSVPMSYSWGNGELRKGIVLSSSENGISPEVWYSPALHAVLDVLEIGPSNHHERCEFLKEIVRVLIGSQGVLEASLVLTPEDVIRALFARKYPSAVGRDARISSRFQEQWKDALNAFKKVGDIALLRTWEYTLASFSEIKFDFTRWNLYSSLGLSKDAVGGIGPCIYESIQMKNEQLGRDLEEIQRDIDYLYPQVRMLETRMRHIGSENEAAWLKAEYESRVNELYALQEKGKTAQIVSQGLVNLYQLLYDSYSKLFQEFFQEVYDPEIDVRASGPFDDRPAGFRLLYKHGRKNPSQWTLIDTPDAFIDALVQFFLVTEKMIGEETDPSLIDTVLSEIVTLIVQQVRTRQFLESSFERVAKIHGVQPVVDPLNHLDQIEKKPWAYTSGGTVSPLVACYYRLENPLQCVERWVESPTELLVFLLDVMKQIGHAQLKGFFARRRQYFLIHSPTHAFLFRPFSETMIPFWSDLRRFTYTHVRDAYILPSQWKFEAMLIPEGGIRYFIEALSLKIPFPHRDRFRSLLPNFSTPLTPPLLREAIMTALRGDHLFRRLHLLRVLQDEIDHLLHLFLPLFPAYELEGRLQRLFSQMGFSPSKIDALIDIARQHTTHSGTHWLGSYHLQGIAQLLIALHEKSVWSAQDVPKMIRMAAIDLNDAPPRPILWADSNWEKDFFAFLINPGTGELELWRTDALGIQGFPLSAWKNWLDGSRRDPKWGVYIAPTEYGQV